MFLGRQTVTVYIVGRRGITIPSVFVAGSTGSMLGQFDKRLKYAVILLCATLPTFLLVIHCVNGVR